MEFQTKVMLPKQTYQVGYDHPALMMGSCFAEEMGALLDYYRFPVVVNPFGTVYNPFSMAEQLERMLDGKRFDRSELRCQDSGTNRLIDPSSDGLWISLLHHSRFNACSEEEALATINGSFSLGCEMLERASTLILTWGSAYVYLFEGKVVSNCHKIPEALFTRRRISSEEIVERYKSLFRRLFSRFPKLNIVLSVSPIRHLRDGLHENNLSKATLLLASDALSSSFPQLSYFPAYEIVVDELRDYRFYAEDMCHPSSQSVRYVWERWTETALSPEDRLRMKEEERKRRKEEHRPLNAL